MCEREKEQEEAHGEGKNDNKLFSYCVLCWLFIEHYCLRMMEACIHNQAYGHRPTTKTTKMKKNNKIYSTTTTKHQQNGQQDEDEGVAVGGEMK